MWRLAVHSSGAQMRSSTSHHALAVTLAPIRTSHVHSSPLASTKGSATTNSASFHSSRSPSFGHLTSSHAIRSLHSAASSRSPLLNSNQSDATATSSSSTSDSSSSPLPPPLVDASEFFPSSADVGDGPILDKAALKAAHQARFRKMKEAEEEAKRKRREELGITEEEEEAAKAAEGEKKEGEQQTEDAQRPEGSDAATSTTSADAKLSSPPPPPPPPRKSIQWQKMFQQLKKAVAEEAAAALAAAKPRPRPTIQKSAIKPEEWGTDPLAAAKAKAEEEKKKAKADEDAAVDEKVDPNAPNALVLVKTEKEESLSRKFFGFIMRPIVESPQTRKLRRWGMQQQRAASEADVVIQVKDRIEAFREDWETSQDPSVIRAREFVDRITGETETGSAFAELLKIDPNWNTMTFLKQMEEVFIPDIVSAFRVGDQKLLRSVVEGPAASAMFASFRERDIKGVDWDPRVFDIRGIDIVKATILEYEPIIILTFVAQHYDCDISRKTGKPVEDAKKSIQNTHYSLAIRRDYEHPFYDWKILEFHYQHVHSLV